jgi:hypothetical protein
LPPDCQSSVEIGRISHDPNDSHHHITDGGVRPDSELKSGARKKEKRNMIILLPFLIANAIRQHHNNETQLKQLDLQQKQYELNLREYNESHSHVTVKRGIIVYHHKKPST